MAWVYLDDHWDEHPKLVAAYEQNAKSIVLFFASLALCRRSRTDGLIQASKARGLLGFCAASRDALITHGLWHRLETGAFEVHDYGQWNKTASERSASARNAATIRWKGQRE